MAHRSSHSASSARAATTVVLIIGVVVALGAHLALSRSLNVNWDEWSFLAKVHTWTRGDPLSRLQTFHVHLFAPLLLNDATRPDRELVEVLRLRAVSFGLLGVSAGALILLGRRLLDSVTAGLAAAFVALTFSFVLGHGTAARYDPFIVTAFLVAAVAVVEAQRASTTRRAAGLAAFAGVVLAVGAAVSIKIAIYGPTLAILVVAGAIAATDAAGRRRGLVVAVVCGVVALVGWRALLAWHGAVIVSPPASTSTAPALATQLSTIGDMMLATDTGGPARKYLRLSQRYDLGFWVLGGVGVVVGAVVALGRGPVGMRTGVARVRVVQALACALPLAALLVYRNTYPYFFVTVVPPAALLVGVVVAVVEGALTSSPWVRSAVVLAVCGPGAWTGARFVAFNHDAQQEDQRAAIAAVHAVFPTPVPYVDRCGMIASHPRVGPFMSSVTMAAYRSQGALVWPALLDTARPQFLLHNISSLDLRQSADSGSDLYRWLPEDHRLLQESFIHHWGPLWVAGRTVTVGEAPVSFVLHIGGRYVVEAPTPVELDGVVVVPGSIVEVSAGAHRASAAAETTLTLRTARAGPPPSLPVPGRLFSSFRPRGVPGSWFGGKARNARPVADAGDEEAP